MSIVIYGPPGCGKTHNAERLRKFFNCISVSDSESFRYPKTDKEKEHFKNGNVLFLTTNTPPIDWTGTDRRFIKYDDAMKLLETSS